MEKRHPLKIFTEKLPIYRAVSVYLPCPRMSFTLPGGGLNKKTTICVFNCMNDTISFDSSIETGKLKESVIGVRYFCALLICFKQVISINLWIWVARTRCSTAMFCRAFLNSNNAGNLFNPRREFRNTCISFRAATSAWLYGPGGNTNLLSGCNQWTAVITAGEASPHFREGTDGCCSD